MIEIFKHEYFAVCDKCGKELPREFDRQGIYDSMAENHWVLKMGKHLETFCSKCREGLNDKSN